MKFNPIPLITLCLLVSISAISQDDTRYLLRLQNSAFVPEKNITAEKINTINQRAVVASGKSFVIIQFDALPADADKQRLQRSGIELIDYIPGNAYTAIVNGSLGADVLIQSKARAVVPMTASMKSHPALLKSVLPAYAIKIIGTIDVWISFPKLFSFGTVSAELTARNFEINNSLYDRYRIIGLRIPQQRLQELASLPFIDYIQPAPPEETMLNDKSISNARGNVLTSSLGRNLTGQGVVIGIGDNGDPSTHPDFTGRLINRHAGGAGAHGHHVTGTAAGAGIMNEKYTGYAPKATILAQLNSGILHSLPSYVQDHGMVITNNSYGLIVNDCNNFGAYDLTSRLLDQQAFDLPHLENVFAAGNSGLFGLINCNYYSNGYGTVLSGFQSAKNTVVVGNTTENDSIHYVSSRGPVRDGRIKPDITAQGRFVWSAGFGSYWANTGTSMSSPAVAGGLALLYQRYRQLNGNADPKNALMKALLLNGATDLGETGPDYTYGFGWMNLLRSVLMMENNTYYNSTITNGGTHNQVITVPPNTAMLKVMLYWNDPAGTPVSAHALVNDLDLEVIDAATPSTPYLPFILDTLPANILSPATTGIDHINNAEQVVIPTPTAGNHTIRVKGTAITQNPSQEFFIVYDVVPVSTTLTYPIGGEKFLPGDSIYISWDAWGGPPNQFTIEYNNGTGWSTVSTTVHDTARQYKFFFPTTDTTITAQVRVTRNGTGMVSTSNNFTVLGPGVVSLLPLADQCEGYIAINWPGVAKATDYEVMMLRGSEMVSQAIITDTFYTFKGLSKDSVYWVTMRPRMSGTPGRRAIAVSRQPNNGSCGNGISDGDIKIDSITSPAVSGRLLTSNALLASHPITVRIKNLDDITMTGPMDISYTINGGSPVTETINPTINAGTTYTHSFTTGADLSAAGNYDIIVTLTKSGDPVTSNNTATRSVQQLNNPAITLGDLPFTDDFESAPEQSVNVRQVGLIGRDRYDFVNNTLNGRLRTFLNTGIAYSGTKALTLDVDKLIGGTNIDSLTGTFNFAAFDTAAHDIRLDFRYKNHGQLPHAANKVWVRAADTTAWIPVYDLYANQPAADGSYLLAGVRITDSLKAHQRNFSTSFQVRFGQAGSYVAADNDHRAGYTFDDIRFYRVINDIEMIRIDTPSATGCNLGSAEPVRITLRNTASTAIATVPVVLKVDGSIIVTENAGPLGAGATTTFTFTTGFANLAAMGPHSIEVYVDLAADSYHQNDTARLAVTNSPVINTFPYLENFEAGSGSWYTSGKNSSWQYGTPAGIHITGAASGSKAWKTGGGYYNDREESYLYSPCFDISGMTTPTLSLSRALNIEECAGGLCDGAWVEYSLDGKTWNKLGAQGQGTNWYNRTYPGDGSLWSDQDTARWRAATIPLPTSGNNRLRLRFVMSSDMELNKEGIAVDDIHIYDNIYGIYDGPTMGAPVTQTISGGTGWIDFLSSAKLVASIQPNNQNMGSTDVQAYINTAPVRYYNGQYYHDRNITIKPATIALADSVTVRFYFLDSETERLIAGSGCPTCYKPRMAYELGVSKYSDPNDALEDGSVLNDNPGLGWLFINAARAVKVPFDKGYYAEFKVKNFSEFWLNNGGFDNNHPLPVQLLTFTASKAGNRKDVIANWKTGSEISVNRFEIELAKGNEELRRNNFIKIGEVASRGNSGQGAEYNFTDAELSKSGARYYRLKIVDNDGSFTYSAVRSVVFTSDVKWQVYPNPSNGLFGLIYQLNDGEKMRVKVYDAAGKMVYQNNFISNGFVQKTDIDMRASAFAPGLYLLEAESENGKQSFKLLKQ